jgi:hypothetical protein
MPLDHGIRVAYITDNGLRDEIKSAPQLARIEIPDDLGEFGFVQTLGGFLGAEPFAPPRPCFGIVCGKLAHADGIDHCDARQHGFRAEHLGIGEHSKTDIIGPPLYTGFFPGFGHGGAGRSDPVHWPAFGHDPTARAATCHQQDLDLVLDDPVAQGSKLGPDIAFMRYLKPQRQLLDALDGQSP